MVATDGTAVRRHTSASRMANSYWYCSSSRHRTKGKPISRLAFSSFNDSCHSQCLQRLRQAPEAVSQAPDLSRMVNEENAEKTWKTSAYLNRKEIIVCTSQHQAAADTEPAKCLHRSNTGGRLKNSLEQTPILQKGGQRK